MWLATSSVLKSFAMHSGVKQYTEMKNSLFLGKGKGKANPVQAWTGPDVSRRLSLPDFKTVGT